MGPFLSLFENQYILVAVDYVSKWVEVISNKNNDNKAENIFSRFRTPQAIISANYTHFCIRSFEALMRK